jgi:hypothetical protein
MIIIQLWTPHPQRNIQVPCPPAGVMGDGAKGGYHRVKFIVDNLVTQEVRGRIGLLLENREVTVEFLA